ncbi:glutathione S-transferase theta-1b isoform X5 [Brienomyrus brachyistius]|uniref:glutathione S-transferase theta-1b isoform X5 n=1 Tax=Brienomyrus brachyistius TaxID=42636 RepID=UPI0020B1DA68|nr:glutathione S-transferase theta-1b isoform X5 [Brienomyrus brachyistius]
MPLEIYLDLVSEPCRSVYIFAKKNNIPFEFKKILLFKGEQYREEFGKVNYFKKVPVIKDGDFTVSESIAILIYLAEKYGTPDHWYPADLQTRARVDEYLSWQHSGMRKHAAKILWLKLMIPKAFGIDVPKEKMDSAMEDLEETLTAFEEKFLQDKPFIAGQKISLADLVAIVEIMQPLGAGVNVFEVRPKLRAWKDRVRAEIGPVLFDEAHQMIFNVEEVAKTIDPSAKEIFKPKIIKLFL